MKPDFLNWLISPDNGAPLEYDPAQQVLLTPGKEYAYTVETGVPLLLPEGAAEKVMNTALHRRHGADFYYIAHYQADAEHFDYFGEAPGGASRHEQRRLHETITAAVPAGVSRILDVGCGKAWVARHFCPQQVEVCSMDVSKTNPVRALREIPYPNHYGVVADVYTLPFPPDTFDCIIASEVMEHVPDPALFVRQLLHVLQPGGTLIITTPYREDRRFSLCVHCNRPTPLHAHLHVFDETSIRRLVNEGSARSVQLRIFSNKALARLQTHVLLQCLPFGAWQSVDQLANQLYPYPTRLMMNIQKA